MSGLTGYQLALEALDGAVKNTHAAGRVANDLDPALVTAWICIASAVTLKDDGSPEPSVYVMGPPSVPFWQDIGLLQTALARYTRGGA